MPDDIMDGERLPNGSRARFDGGGDGWANAHRDILKSAYMDDFDCFAWMEQHVNGVWHEDSEDTVFAEYEPDHWDLRDEEARDFALVAMFDRKITRWGWRQPRAKLSAQFQRHVCRTYSRQQPVGGKPQFFLVIGPKNGPAWELIRINLRTGAEEESWPLTKASWQLVWRAAGISQVRANLRAWFQQQHRAREA